MLGRLRNEPVVYIGLAVLSLGIAAGVTFGDGLWNDWSDDAHDFIGRAETLLWFLFLFLQFTIWIGVQPPLWSMAGRVAAGERWPSTVVYLLLFALMIAVVVYVATTVEVRFPLPGHDLKLAILTVFGLIAITPGLLAVLRVQRLSGRLAPTVGTPDWKADLARALKYEEDEHPETVLLGLRNLLDNVLALLGVVLAAAVASVAAFRNAIVAWSPPVAEGARPVIRIEYVLGYGAAFTALLALLYIPAVLNVRALCTRAVKELIPIDRDSLDWEDKTEEREKVEKRLKLDISVGSSLTAGAGIIAPLIAALIAALLPT